VGAHFTPRGFEIVEVSTARMKANAFYVFGFCDYATL
jgi:hypothetical protein